MKCFRFSWIFNFQKSRVFLLRCSLHCAHILHILVSIIPGLSWHLHFFSVYWFFQLLKMNDFNFFLDFRHFFGFQLMSFNIRQYWEFDSKPSPKLSLMTIYCNFLQAFLPESWIIWGQLITLSAFSDYQIFDHLNYFGFLRFSIIENVAAFCFSWWQWFRFHQFLEQVWRSSELMV